MADFDERAPVLVAVGEASGRSLGLEWPSPTDLTSAAIKTALDDSGQGAALTAAIDCIAAIRSFEDSGVSMGTGSPENVPQAYAHAAGIAPQHFIYADIGGQSPQAIVSEMAGAVRRGEYRAVVIAGGEANGTAKRARKQGKQLDWRQPSDIAFDNRLSSYPILSRAEIRHAVISMPLAYSLIETARRVRLGLSPAEYDGEMAQLWAAFSARSLGRDHAQFAKDWTAEALQSDADGNYQLTQIYRRWMVAQDAVDVAGALILTTAGMARQLGIAEDKMIWLTGAAEAADVPLSERANIAGSDALSFAAQAALDQAGVTAAQLGPVDIYSCFPCAVFAAIDAVGAPERPLGDYTLTGGLSFFGGPGNGYALHSLTAMVQALRQNGEKPAMVTANGGVMSKQAIGIYSAVQPARPWTGEVAGGYQPATAALDHMPSGKGRVLSYCQPVVKDVPGAATLLLEMEHGARALAMMAEPPPGDLAGAIVRVTAGEKRHQAALE
ncbi:hypothetical protein ACFOWX_12965 [Sphingorhabdus arenilitoris]|uniref:Acetyl-CoA acetyltransferase n=1 Tax=Sphingorhabdus arenilitoris TaxID=1490041 RepID=A0ABV8RIW6_9SPHN